MQILELLSFTTLLTKGSRRRALDGQRQLPKQGTAVHCQEVAGQARNKLSVSRRETSCPQAGEYSCFWSAEYLFLILNFQQSALAYTLNLLEEASTVDCSATTTSEWCSTFEVTRFQKSLVWTVEALLKVIERSLYYIFGTGNEVTSTLSTLCWSLLLQVTSTHYYWL